MKKNKQEYLSFSADETHAIGRELGKILKWGSVVVFKGDLGSGKTTLIRGLVEGVQGQYNRAISSPTFSLLNIYAGTPEIYHFDLYRLPRLEEFIALGFDEYLEREEGISCIEWPEIIEPLLPPSTLFISISYSGEQKRKIYAEQNTI